MNKIFRGNMFFLMICLLFACLAHGANQKESVSAQEKNAAAQLHANYEQMGERLVHNNFGRPLYLETEESSDALKGEVYARVDYPFATVRSALGSAPQWCEVLILHLNI